MPCTPTAACDAGIVLAAVRAADGVALVVLLAFTWWGARKGALRQALSLGLLAGAFWAAGRFQGAVEPTVGKLFALTTGERGALAWGVVLFGVLLVGGLILRFLTTRLRARSEGGGDRVLGGLLGAAKGAVVLTVAGYALLSFGSVPSGPSLSRPAGPPSSALERPDLTARVRGSVAAVCLTEWGALLRRWVHVPAWIEGRVEQVNRKIEAEAGPPARPSGH